MFQVFYCVWKIHFVQFCKVDLSDSGDLVISFQFLPGEWLFWVCKLKHRATKSGKFHGLGSISYSNSMCLAMARAELGAGALWWWKKTFVFVKCGRCSTIWRRIGQATRHNKALWPFSHFTGIWPISNLVNPVDRCGAHHVFGRWDNLWLFGARLPGQVYC